MIPFQLVACGDGTCSYCKEWSAELVNVYSGSHCCEDPFAIEEGYPVTECKKCCVWVFDELFGWGKQIRESWPYGQAI